MVAAYKVTVGAVVQSFVEMCGAHLKLPNWCVCYSAQRTEHHMSFCRATDLRSGTG